MKKIITLTSLTLAVLICLHVKAQQVISSAGASATGINVQLSWTVGEPVIETFFGTSAILTQGFHQSRLTVTVIDPIGNPGMTLSVYPNPVSDFLKLEIPDDGFGGFGFMLFGLDGKLLLDKKVEKQPELINMGSYPTGTYLLKVSRGNKEHLQTFKIVKN